MTILVLIVGEKNVTNAKSDNTFHLYFRYRDSGGRVREYIYIKWLSRRDFQKLQMDLKFATNTTLLKIKSYILKISTDIYIIPFTQFTI